MSSASNARAVGVCLGLAALAASAAPPNDPATQGAGRPTAVLRSMQPAAPIPSGIRASDLRVCADPNNLPYSNARGEGFENELAELIGADLHRPVRYTWQPQRRGFIRSTLATGDCDLVIGVPAHYALVATTRPYYRSIYMIVTRHGDQPGLGSLDDPRLRSLRVGVHVVGDDYNNVPPAQALAWRDIVGNLRGFPIYGDYSKPDPARNLIDAVALGDIDVALAWGPLAGYFARREPAALDIVPVAPQIDRGSLPMFFAIAMGVRRGDLEFRDLIQGALDRRRPEIEAILRRFDVPLLDMAGLPPLALKE